MFKSYLSLILAVVFWASAFVAIRVGLEDFLPGSLALMRYIVASICMLIMLKLFKLSIKIPFKDFIFLGLLSGFGISAYNICLNYGEQIISAGLASFIIAQMPVVMIGLSYFIYKTPITKWQALGISISFAGVFVMFFQDLHTSVSGSGILLVSLSTVCMSLYTVLQKPMLKKLHPIVLVSYVIWWSLPVFSIYSGDLISDLGHVHSRAGWAVVYLGIFPAAGSYMLWSYALANIPSQRASVWLYAMPFIAAALEPLFLSSSLSIMALIGGVVAMFGVVISNHFTPLQNKFIQLWSLLSMDNIRKYNYWNNIIKMEKY